MWGLRIIFDAVLYAVKIVASVYTVQWEHIKRDVMRCAYAFVSTSLRYVSAKN